MDKTKIIAGGGLVLNTKGELLMIFRRGKWDLPKGKLEEGETIETCAVREVMEETGLANIERGEQVATTHHDYFDTYRNENVVKETHWFAMRAPGSQVLTPQAEEDITAIKWVSGDELDTCLQNSYASIVEVITKAGLLEDRN
jgi:8-oxo-dGTP pyrophosphatase MutT (NUDIX family)